MGNRGKWKRTEEYKKTLKGENSHRYGKPASNRCEDRFRAMEEGRKFYISPSACKKCGCVIKFVSSYGCHFCVKKKGYEKLISGDLKKYQTPETLNNKTYRYRSKKYSKQPILSKEENEKIKKIYEECRKITKDTGILHHVDHIIPISKGGKHHSKNLQILTASDNIRKSNHLL